MNKKFKKILCGVIVGICVLGISVNARSIQNLNYFQLPAWQGVTATSSLVKAATNRPWVINITSLTNTSSVDTYLANSAGDRRSDYVTVGETRSEITSWGQAGYSYHAVLMNAESGANYSAYVTGSWSPDSY